MAETTKMTKPDARYLLDTGRVTWGHLKTMLRSEMGAPAQRSRINPTMTHAQSVDILALAIDVRDDSDVVGGQWSTARRDRLIAVNVLRECADSLPADLAQAVKAVR